MHFSMQGKLPERMVDNSLDSLRALPMQNSQSTPIDPFLLNV